MDDNRELIAISVVYKPTCLYFMLTNPYEFVGKFHHKDFVGNYKNGVSGMCFYDGHLILISGKNAGGHIASVKVDFDNGKVKLTGVSYTKQVVHNGHDIIFWKEDGDLARFLVTDTYHDRVKIIDLDRDTKKIVGHEVLFQVECEQKDTHHFNSLQVYGDKLYVTAAHKDDPKRKVVKADVLVYDFESCEHEWMELKRPHGCSYKFAHNFIKLSDDAYVICDSMNGCICVHDMKSKHYKEVQVHGWTRGALPLIDNEWLIGASPFHHASPQPDRFERDSIPMPSLVKLDSALNVQNVTGIAVESGACIYAICKIDI